MGGTGGLLDYKDYTENMRTGCQKKVATTLIDTIDWQDQSTSWTAAGGVGNDEGRFQDL